MYSKYALEPSALSAWTSFAEDVADFAASLDAADLEYSQPGFPETFLIQVQSTGQTPGKAVNQMHVSVDPASLVYLLLPYFAECYRNWRPLVQNKHTCE